APAAFTTGITCSCNCAKLIIFRGDRFRMFLPVADAPEDTDNTSDDHQQGNHRSLCKADSESILFRIHADHLNNESLQTTKNQINGKQHTRVAYALPDNPEDTE